MCILWFILNCQITISVKVKYEPNFLQISRDVEFSLRRKPESSGLKTGPWTTQLTACACGSYAVPRGRPLNWRSLILTWKRRASYSAGAMTTWSSMTEHSQERKNTVSEDEKGGSTQHVYEAFYQIKPWQVCVCSWFTVLVTIVYVKFLTGPFCGSKVPGVIESTSNELVISFHADFFTEAKGFRAHWTTDPTLPTPTDPPPPPNPWDDITIGLNYRLH